MATVLILLQTFHNNQLFFANDNIRGTLLEWKRILPNVNVFTLFWETSSASWNIKQMVIQPFRELKSCQKFMCTGEPSVRVVFIVAVLRYFLQFVVQCWEPAVQLTLRSVNCVRSFGQWKCCTLLTTYQFETNPTSSKQLLQFLNVLARKNVQRCEM